MPKWNTTTKHEPNSINDGNRYETKDRLSKEVINAITENAFYAMAKADEALEKADSAFQGNGTIITLGGESQASMEVDSTPQESGTNRLVTSAGVANALKNFTPSGGNEYDDTELRELIDSKLPLSGGTLTGNLKIDNSESDPAIELKNIIFRENVNKSLIIGVPNGVYLRPSHSSGGNSVVFIEKNFRPERNDNVSLGSSSTKWKDIHGINIYQNDKAVANADASNLSTDDVDKWKSKLNLPQYDDSELRNLISNKANNDASNLSTTDVSSWRNKLNVQNIVYDPETKTLTITTE